MDETVLTPVLTIITVTWNSAQVITEQIRSVIKACEKTAFEHIIVDNASTDATTGILERQFPALRVIKNNRNKGFAAANNQAFSQAKGEYILFLNPDMRLNPGSLDVLVAWMRSRPHVGIVGPRLVKEDGSLNLAATPRRFPTLLSQLAILLKLPHLFPEITNHYLARDLDLDQEQPVDSVRGSCLLTRRALLGALGFAFDPRYFLWLEDVDLCREALCRGWWVVYTPVISCIDYTARSFAQAPLIWRQLQFGKSLLGYFKKWEPWTSWIWLWLARPIGLLFAILNALWFKSRQIIKNNPDS